VQLIPARVRSKPQYVFHPLRAAKRLTYRRGGDESAVTELPWDLPLEVEMSDAIGFSIVAGGVFDPCVTETLHRLIDPGDLVVDVGANVGYLTSLAAARAGSDGRVVGLEPHPRVFELLARNADRWRRRDDVAEVELQRLAVSDRDGEGTLVAGPFFDANMGLAALAPEEGAGEGASSIPVTLARLDALVGASEVGLLKIDVEGHEAEVLRGASELLARRGARDIVFEDHDPYPSEPTEIVEAAGYELISLDNDLLGLRLEAPEDRGQVAAWPGPSYLATRDPQRARKRLRRRGWQVRGIGPGVRARFRQQVRPPSTTST
jgi:FkbM family methyltransferase